MQLPVYMYFSRATLKTNKSGRHRVESWVSARLKGTNDELDASCWPADG